MDKLTNNLYKVYLVQISCKESGITAHKIGITQYKDALHRFHDNLEQYNIKVLQTILFTSKIKAEAFESMLLTIYNKKPTGDLKNFNDINGNGELISLSEFERKELLSFLFNIKKNKSIVL
jgi:hypothetical protein